MSDIEKQLAFKDRRIETLEAIALDRNLVDDAGWWGRFASHLCTEKNKLKQQLEAERGKAENAIEILATHNVEVARMDAAERLTVAISRIKLALIALQSDRKQ